MNRFKKSVVVNHSWENSIKNVYPQVFTQFIADNVDCNIRTLDGSGKFHGIGIISISTAFPGNSVWKQSDSVPREKDISSAVLVKNKGISIHHYVQPIKPALSSTEIKPLIQLQSPVILPTNDIDNLWQASWYFRNSSDYRTDWSGHMQNVTKGNYPGKSEIMFLPITDLNPTKENYLFYSFVHSRSSKDIKYCHSLHNI